jgi:RNA polymerase sigma factor (sigma-70 family)
VINHSIDNCFSTKYPTFVTNYNQQNRILTEREFKRLFDEHYQPLCNFAFRIIPDMDMVEDVVQDAFVKIWQKGDTIDIDQNIKSYLYTMTKNNCLEIIRREGIGRKAAEEIKHTYIIEEGDVNEAEVEKWLLLDKIYVSMRQM